MASSSDSAATSTDPVSQVIDFVFERMQIDDEWSVREAHGFAWWGGELRQRIWADPPREEQGTRMQTVHIETDLLADVDADDQTFARLAGVNRLATLSAYVSDGAERKVRLHASVSVTADNWPIARALALHATAIQVADAHAEAEPLAQIFEARVDRSGHPTRGARDERDEMLGVLPVYEQRGEEASPWDADEMAGLVHLEPRPWQSASTTLEGLEAELPFGDRPARLELDADTRHPALGSGLHFRLVLPVDPGAALVQRLNASERLQPDAHQLGGWCLDEERGVMFVSFLPAAAHMPNLARALVYHLSARSDWARAQIFPAG